MEKLKYIQEVGKVFIQILSDFQPEILAFYDTLKMNRSDIFLEEKKQNLGVFEMLATNFLDKIAQASRKIAEKLEKKQPVYTVGFLPKEQKCNFCKKLTQNSVIDFNNRKSIISCPEHYNDAIQQFEEMTNLVPKLE